MQSKPTYVVIELRTAGLDGDDGLVREALEAEDDASAIADAIATWGKVPFDLVRSDAPDKRSVSIYSHTPSKAPPKQGHI